MDSTNPGEKKNKLWDVKKEPTQKNMWDTVDGRTPAPVNM